MFEQGDFFSASSCLAGDPEATATDDVQTGEGGLVAVPTSSVPIHPQRGWHITRHVCRVCFGRVLTRAVAGAREFICSNCEFTVTARSHRAICQCGAKFSDVRRGPGKRIGGSMGLRCIKNPNRGPSSPSVIVAGERA